MIRVPVGLDLPQFIEPFLHRLNLDLAPDDGMYAGNDHHYLSCGASALAVILSSLRLAGTQSPTSILDFGAGAGRVTRWLRAAFPDASIDVCDLRMSDIEFCARAFEANCWISGIDIASLKAPRTYDLIWLGSVATHLSAGKTRELIEKMISWCSPDGLVVMSFHGRYALIRQNTGEFTYIDAERWMLIQRGYAAHGYGYSDYAGQVGYGISVAKPSWMAATIEERPNIKLVCISERAWDGHHDVIAMQLV
jgi:SAM-dependent methyltransferase